jgi:hypothetical protein
MKNEQTIQQTPSLPIGEWKIGDKDYFISFALTHKPNLFRRWMARLFFGLVWIDYTQPKEVKDIQAGKGVSVGITKISPKGRRAKLGNPKSY